MNACRTELDTDVHLGGLLDRFAGSHFRKLKLLDFGLGSAGTLSNGNAKVTLHSE